jgi:hypothetical protein
MDPDNITGNKFPQAATFLLRDGWNDKQSKDCDASSCERHHGRHYIASKNGGKGESPSPQPEAGTVRLG